MKRLNLILVFIGIALLSGCSTMKQKTTHTDGSVTERTASGFMITLQGYSDTGDNPDGSTYATTIQNLTGDAQMMREIRALVTELTQSILLANGYTNAFPTNFAATAKSPRFLTRRAR